HCLQLSQALEEEVQMKLFIKVTIRGHKIRDNSKAFAMEGTSAVAFAQSADNGYVQRCRRGSINKLDDMLVMGQLLSSGWVGTKVVNMVDE
ncbi:hypothetical protein HPP92_004443, partial [Vanilla planifolia]